ncbi:methylated-DNA--[protein]-cysteine S-methyltransferase [Sulfitobacter sp. LCG007]
MPHVSVLSPFGTLRLFDEDGAIVRVTWGSAPGDDETEVLREAARQIAQYAAREREAFELPLRVDASDFQRDVCDAIAAIPYGETRTYGEIAKELGVTPQAVGQACGANPIPVIIPCHRVLGARGLTGYSGGRGIETKVALLCHERAAGLLI